MLARLVLAAATGERLGYPTLWAHLLRAGEWLAAERVVQPGRFVGVLAPGFASG